MKKTLEELNSIREQTFKRIQLRKSDDSRIHIVISMDNCGLAAGAREIMLEFIREIEKRELYNISITQTACVGMCKYKPIADILIPGQDPVRYVHIKPSDVARIVSEHIIGGNIVTELTLSDKEQ